MFKRILLMILACTSAPVFAAVHVYGGVSVPIVVGTPVVPCYEYYDPQQGVYVVTRHRVVRYYSYNPGCRVISAPAYYGRDYYDNGYYDNGYYGGGYVGGIYIGGGGRYGHGHYHHH